MCLNCLFAPAAFALLPNRNAGVTAGLAVARLESRMKAFGPNSQKKSFFAYWFAETEVAEP